MKLVILIILVLPFVYSQYNCGLQPCLNIKCPGLKPNTTSTCRVAFRLDDIQDYFVVPAQMAIMDFFKANNTPMTAGIIGGATKFGNDKKILSYMREVVSDPYWEVEIACHGSNHTDFSKYDFNQTVYQIQDSIKNIKRTLNVPYVTTFVPPFNLFNNVTVPALKYLNFTHWSAQIGTDYVHPKPLSGQSFYGFPIGAATNDLSDDTIFIGQSWQISFAAIQSQLLYYGWSAVMMHPQEFTVYGGSTQDNTVNTTQLEQLRLLLLAVKQQGWELVPIGRLNLDAPNITLTGSGTGFGSSSNDNSIGSPENLATAYVIVAGVFGGIFFLLVFDICCCFHKTEFILS